MYLLLWLVLREIVLVYVGSNSSSRGVTVILEVLHFYILGLLDIASRTTEDIVHCFPQ
jgi:hypothetical protein